MNSRVNKVANLAFLMAAMMACAGCQTFSLTEEQWERQQNGGVADARVGGVVGAVGSAGYLAAGVGAAVAGALK